ncbi:MAG TPA: riboflavin synthase [bacterium]|nr:riboflavin synthase [bacterium]
MFTGIIEGVGQIRSIRRKGDGAEIEIGCDFDLEKTNVGDSVSVNGCCLTVTSRLGKSFWADLSPETLQASTFSEAGEGDPVNLERALKVGERLSGHIVQGHVDGVGKVVDIKEYSGSREFVVEIPGNLLRYVVEKGSVAVDGVSLTVNRCEGATFSVMVIPHTQLKSTFQFLKRGDKVNLEVDIIGKYVEKLTFLDSEEFKKDSKITEEFLKKHGF